MNPLKTGHSDIHSELWIDKIMLQLSTSAQPYHLPLP